MIAKSIKITAKKILDFYAWIGYPLLPITRLMVRPMRWYYHQDPLLKHDSTGSFKSLVLLFLHRLLVNEHSPDFTIYQNQIQFRSVNSIMSIHGYYVGEIEYHLVKYIVSQIKSDFVMIDVGAHHGLYTTIVAYELKKRGLKGVVYSFEPDPKNFSLLKHNLKQNELSEYVNLYPMAVSDTDGVESFIVYQLDNSGNTLEKTSNCSIPEGANVISQKVKTVALDTLFTDISHINLIKIDIQGGEPVAIEGAKKVIERCRPILVLEAIQEWSSTQQLQDLLLNYNYKIYGVDKQSRLCEANSPQAFVSWDWVAIPKSN
jgi:FkbM family methyltransferase